jgi:broad specificity phosphatase PhoE
MIGEKVLFMVRHGSLINSNQGVLNGQSDTPLTKQGLKETMKWKTYFKQNGVDVVISSDLKRSLIPAKKYSQYLKKPHLVFRDLREIDAGKWELKNVKEVMEKEGEYYMKRVKNPANIPFPNGESLKMLKKRVVDCIKELLMSDKYNRILYVGHAGVIRVIMLSYLGLSLNNFFKLEVDFGSLTILRFFKDGIVTLKLFNSNNENAV